MRKLQSLERDLKRLRNKHTQQSRNEKWVEMQTTRGKIKAILDSIVMHFPKWREQ